jgi:hypothetical protein
VSNSDNSFLSSSVLFKWKVDFLHRTVRDFPIEKEMQDLLTGWARSGFNADFMICEALLAQIKTSLQEAEYLYPHGPVEELVSIFNWHVRCMDEQNRAGTLTLTDTLKETMQGIRAATGLSGETPTMKFLTTNLQERACKITQIIYFALKQSIEVSYSGSRNSKGILGEDPNTA